MPAPQDDVFICYSRKDGEFAAKLERALEAYRPPRGRALEGRYRVERELGEGGMKRMNPASTAPRRHSDVFVTSFPLKAL